MDVVQVPVDRLASMAAPYNPRRISEHDLGALRRSLRAFGVVEPIVVNQRTGHIVGGHQRVVAARAEGLAELPVVHVDLDEAGERQLNLALNRISGQWDQEKLAALLGELRAGGADLKLTGFTEAEILDVISSHTKPRDGRTDPDAVPAPLPNALTEPADLIILGRHRLLCGDSALRPDLERLLAGASVQLVNTDPPYNVNAQPRYVKKAEREKLRPRDREILNDSMPDGDFEKLLQRWFGSIALALEPGRSFYIWGGSKNLERFPSALVQAGLHYSQLIIWDKQWPVVGRSDFMGQHEVAYYGWRDFGPEFSAAVYGWKEGATHYFAPGVNNATDLWHVKKVTPAAMIHLTEKPVELAERALNYSSRIGEHVLDLFGGSGSTLIAAERLDRRAFLMELDPVYCDVIVRRWEAFSGQKAEGWRGHG